MNKTFFSKFLLISAFVALSGSLLHAVRTVINTADSGAGSLRDEIIAASPNVLIQFAIPGAGPHVISLLSPININLANEAGINIDAYTQAGAARATDTTAAIIKVRVDGASNVFNVTVNGVTIQGLSITGATLPGGDGINIQASNTKVFGNYIGLGPDGSTIIRNDDEGVDIQSGTGNQIGDGTPGNRNVISGNGDPLNNAANHMGVRVASNGNFVVGNYIGVDALGVAAKPNTGDGVRFTDDASGNLVQCNLISQNGTASVPGSGAGIRARNNTFANVFSANAAFNNRDFGIDLEGNANNGQNFPTITSAIVNTSTVSLIGFLNSNPGSYRLEFFYNPTVNQYNPNNTEGRVYIGFINVTIPAGSTSVPFSLKLLNIHNIQVGQFVSATATLLNGVNQVETSEYSENVQFIAGSAESDLSLAIFIKYCNTHATSPCVPPLVPLA